VSHCGICGSDLHFVLDGWGRTGGTGGHEWSGVVVATGPGVTRWRVGDRVVGAPGPGCGSCPLCTSGRPSLCERRFTPGTGSPERGAFATYVKADQDHLLGVPEGLGLRQAALAEPLAVALHAVSTSQAAPGQRVLVLGAGPIGLLCTAVLVDMGVSEVVVCEPAEARRRRALEVGATEVLAPEDLGRPAMPMDLVEAPFHAALECSGRAEAQEAALAQLGRAGILVLVGAGMGRPRFEANRILLNELVVTGSNEYWAGDFDRSLGLLASGRLPLDRLIEPEDVPLSGLLEAMRGLAAGEIPAKVLVAPRLDP
jgi:(R,R)-butanediol dehydrogenase/meso-butanediol dehydrogenase/diacetyl reductase